MGLIPYSLENASSSTDPWGNVMTSILQPRQTATISSSC